MTASAPENRRAHRRARAKSLAAHVETEAGTVTGNVEDLSLGGLFVRTDRTLPVASPVAVSLARPGMKRALRVPGIIANARTVRDAQASGGAPGIGIEFGALGPLETARLVELIRAFASSVPTEPPPPAPPVMEPRTVSTATDSGSGELQRLRTQVRGLLLELDELRRRIDEQDGMIAQLIEDNARQTRELELLGKIRALLASARPA